MRSQPLAVVRGQIVLPLRDRDVRVHVNLGFSQDVGHVRSLFAAVLGI